MSVLERKYANKTIRNINPALSAVIGFTRYVVYVITVFPKYEEKRFRQISNTVIMFAAVVETLSLITIKARATYPAAGKSISREKFPPEKTAKPRTPAVKNKDREREISEAFLLFMKKESAAQRRGMKYIILFVE